MHCVIKMSSSIQRNLRGSARSTMTRRCWSLLLLLLNPWDALPFSSATKRGECLPKGGIGVVPWWESSWESSFYDDSTVLVSSSPSSQPLGCTFLFIYDNSTGWAPTKRGHRSCALMTSSWWSCHSSGSCAWVVMVMHRRSEWSRENR